MLRSGLLTIHPLPNEAGSAADRSFFFAQRRSKRLACISRRARRGDRRFIKKIEPQIKMADLGWLEAG